MKPSLAIDHTPPSRSGFHAEPVPGSGWDDGERIATTEPRTFDDDEEAEATHATFEMKLARLLQWLTDGGTVESAGRKALLLAHLAGQGPQDTDAKLAKKIGVSRARVSQLRRAIANDFGRFARCNGRRA